MSSNDIHDLFAANAPEDPSTQGWADNVRGRRRRRRVLTGVAAGILAVGLAVPVGLSILTPAGRTAAPAQQPLVERTAAEVCAEARAMVAEEFTADAFGEASLQTGAVRAWLCGDEVTDDDGFTSGTAGPADAITTGVETAIDWFLNAEDASPVAACTMEYILTYTAVFEYEDGSIAPVQGTLHGCRSVTDGSATKEGGQEFYDLLQDLWAENRGDGFVVEATPCTASATMGEADPAEAVSAALCQHDASGAVVISELTAEDAAAIGTSVAETGTTAPDMMTYPEEPTTLELFDASGDLLSLDALDDGSFLFYSDNEARAWTPSAELRSVLEGAAAQPLP